jgi:hypothetical protein
MPMRPALAIPAKGPLLMDWYTFCRAKVLSQLGVSDVILGSTL